MGDTVEWCHYADHQRHSARGLAPGRPRAGAVSPGQATAEVDGLLLQALFTVSEEGGEHRCLDVLPGRVRRLPDGLKVPHMGWNSVRQSRPHPVFEGIPDGAFFYFVHSYYAEPQDPSVVVGETAYGVTFAAVVAKANIVATQFHPEKSGEVGLRLYENFLRLAREGGFPAETHLDLRLSG